MKTSLFTRLCALALAAGALNTLSASGTVLVYGEATASGPTITVRIFADTPDTALRSFGVRLLYDATLLSVQAATRNSAEWFFFDGTNSVAYIEPESATPGTVTILGGKMNALAPLQGVMASHVLLGTVSFTRSALPAPSGYSFSLGLGRTLAFANFVTTSSVVLDTIPGALKFQSVTIDPNDTNLNGLPDAWEIQYFGALGTTSWSADPDGDGFNNLQEYLADTRPNDPSSYPHFSRATLVGGGVSLQWAAGVEATQYVQRRFTLSPSEPWQDIFTNPPPTATNVTYLDTLGTNTTRFYRLRFTR